MSLGFIKTNYSRMMFIVFVLVISTCSALNYNDIVEHSYRSISQSFLKDISINTSLDFSYSLSHHFLNANLKKLSPECQKDSAKWQQALVLFSPWAIGMIDASGKLESDLMNGNFLFLGSYDECMDLNRNRTVYEPAKTVIPAADIRVHMCSVNINLVPQVSPVVLLCIPQSCNGSEIASIINPELKKYAPSLSLNGTGGICKDDKAKSLDNSAWVVLSIVITLVSIVTISTFLHIISDFKSESDYDNQETLTHGLLNDGEQTHGDEVPLIVPDRGMLKSSFLEFFAQFSMILNGKKILNTNRDNGIEVIHGVRFLSMTWVILGHTFAFGEYFLQNPMSLVSLASSWSFQVIINGILSVDTFFLLSGTLTSYLLLKKLRNEGVRQFNWFYFVLHRFWRLTPPYMLLLGINTTLSKYWSSGPQWPQEGLDSKCGKHWWANLLYINNNSPYTDCFGWAWYLACDFQYYIVSPIFIISLFYCQYIGIILVVTMMAGSSIYIGVLTKLNNYGPNEIFNGLIHSESYGQEFKLIYTSFIGRINPYMIGILLGYLMYKINGKLVLSKTFVAICWFFSTVLALLIVYGLVDYPNKHFSSDISAFYRSLQTTVWSLSISWLIVACWTGNGGPINVILSWSILRPLSRLTYMAYLVHPIIMFSVFLRMRTRIHFEMLTIVIYYLAFLVLSYGAAFLLSLVFESPVINLEKFIQKKFRRTNRQNTEQSVPQE